MLYWRKEKWIQRFVTGKKVLDLGCVDHDLDRTDRPWLHAFIRQHAASVLGVDCLPEAIDQLRQRGFDAVCADVQTMDLGRTFDVIVAGDLIEHLSNPGLFLARVKAHLAAGGVFLVTTPNPVTFLRFLRALVSGKTHANKQHTCWFSSKVLCHLASRYGFEVADESYVDDTRFSYRIVRRAPGPEGKRGLLRTVGFVLRRLAWQPAVLIGSLLCLLRPRLAETLCLALKLGQH